MNMYAIAYLLTIYTNQIQTDMNENETAQKSYIIVMSEMCDGVFFFDHSEKFATNTAAHYGMIGIINDFLSDYLDLENGEMYTPEMLKEEGIKSEICFNEASLIWEKEPLKNYRRYNIVEV